MGSLRLVDSALPRAVALSRVLLPPERGCHFSQTPRKERGVAESRAPSVYAPDPNGVLHHPLSSVSIKERLPAAGKHAAAPRRLPERQAKTKNAPKMINGRAPTRAQLL